MGRAMRRHHKQRVQNNALRLLMNTWMYSAVNRPEYVEDYARRHADHLCVCSCSMCSKHRKYDGDPIQEQKQPTLKDWDV